MKFTYQRSKKLFPAIGLPDEWGNDKGSVPFISKVQFDGKLSLI
jgi:hypothetical protein